MADRKNISSNRMRLKIKFESKPRHYFEKKLIFYFNNVFLPLNIPLLKQASSYECVCVYVVI